MSRHARRSSRRPIAAVGAAAVAAAAVAVPLAAQASSAAPPAPVKPAEPAVPAPPVLTEVHSAAVPTAHVQHVARPSYYRVRSGDTLWGISGRVCGNPRDYLALAYNSDIANPDLIRVRQLIKEACHAAASALDKRYPPAPASPAPAPDPGLALAGARQAPAQQPDPAPQQPVVTAAGGTLGCAGLEQLWRDAGGSPAAEVTAASVAMAESGGNQYARSPTADYGYWQINISHGVEASFDPLVNAEAAVAISGDGTNWSPWTTYTSGAYIGRC